MKRDSDEIRQPSENKKQENGVNVFNLMELPPSQRKVIRILLHKRQMTYPDLLKTMEPIEPANKNELSEILEALIERGWITRVDDQCVTYKVNLGHRIVSRSHQDTGRNYTPRSRKTR